VAPAKVAACAASVAPAVLATSVDRKAMARVGISSARAVSKDSAVREWAAPECRLRRRSSKTSTPTKMAASPVTNGTRMSRTGRNTDRADHTECALNLGQTARSVAPAVLADVARKVAPARMTAKARAATVLAGSLNCRLPRHPNSNC